LTLHVFADHGAMLPETAGVDLAGLPGVRYTGYRQQRLPGFSARLYQVLHILSRPFNLALSAWFVRRFNRRLAVDPFELQEGLSCVGEGDAVLWINPSLAVYPVVEALRRRRVRLSVYFVDPVHRLGLAASQVRDWAQESCVASYSPEEAAQLGLRFLVPYAPVVPMATLVPDLDLVYVGSPSPKRLLWVLYLHLHLRVRQRRGHLRLALRSQKLVRLLPGLFSGRVSFQDYAALCARSRGVLELHERDAGGVTLRATLCQALRRTHLCNLPTTPETTVISLWRWRALDRFLTLETGTLSSPHAPHVPRVAPGFEPWLRENFG